MLMLTTIHRVAKRTNNCNRPVPDQSKHNTWACSSHRRCSDRIHAFATNSRTVTDRPPSPARVSSLRSWIPRSPSSDNHNASRLEREDITTVTLWTHTLLWVRNKRSGSGIIVRSSPSLTEVNVDFARITTSAFLPDKIASVLAAPMPK